MATTFTPILRLSLSPLLTAEARANLLKIDALGRGILTDLDGNTLVRSAEDISLLPQDASVGGSGIGGAINLGSPSQELDSVTSYAASTRIQGTLDLSDQDNAGGSYLKLSYLSTQNGSVEVVDRSLTLDVGSGDRQLTLNSDLETGPSFLSLGPLDFTLPTSNDALVGAAFAQVLTNKTINATNNTISNLTNTNIAPAAGIVYSKLNLTSSIINADVSPAAAIVGTKIIPSFGAQTVSTSAGLDLSNGAFETRLQASISQTADITLTMPVVVPTPAQVLASSAAPGVLEWVSVGTGTVTSVALAVDAATDAILDVSGSPITTTGTLTLGLATQSAGFILAGPTAGPAAQPTFRALTATDLPNQDEQIQDVIGGILANSTNVTLVYSDVTPSITADLINTAVTPGSYGSTTTTGTFTVDAKGRITTAASATIAIPSSQITDKGTAGGIASLDGSGKVPVAQLPNSIMEYQGTWNATTNSPTLANGVGNPDTSIGDVYRVNVAGTTNFGAGPIAFDIGDYAILNSSKIWEKADTTDAVASVNGLIGVVVLSNSSTWTTGTTFNFTHNLSSTDVRVEIIDLADGQTIWIDTVIRTNANTVGLTSSQAPSVSGWRVNISK